MAAAGFAIAFLTALTATSAVVPHDRAAHPLVLAGLIVAAAIAHRIPFEIANSSARSACCSRGCPTSC